LWLKNDFELEGKSILDFGCGCGYGTSMIAEQAKLVHGIDYCHEAIVFARELYARANVEFFHVDACCSHDLFQVLKPASYDLVVAFEVIEHMEKYFDYLENARRLMKENGLFLLSTPNRLWTCACSQKLNQYHFQEFSPYQLRKVLGMYFRDVTMAAQDFRDSVTREATKRRLAFKRSMRQSNPLTRTVKKTWHSALKRIAPTSNGSRTLSHSNIAISLEPGDEALSLAFALLAICHA
jgi:2-polyprenyl-3-methyl-5-hydroxy-6-metoxy-1,4-benzoquinol methylase